MIDSPELTSDDVEILNEKTLYDGFYTMNELRFRFRKFQGEWSESISRELFMRPGAAALLLYDRKRDVVALTEQCRVGALKDAESPWLLELVAGMIEPGETPEEVARRESIEEANCEVTNLISISNFYSSPGGSNEVIYLFCALIDSEGLGGIHGLVEEHEDIKVHVVPREEAYGAIQSGRINNGSTIIALQWLQLNYKEIVE